MKKIVSFVLVISILFCCMQTVFAQGSSEVVEEQEFSSFCRNNSETIENVKSSILEEMNITDESNYEVVLINNSTLADQAGTKNGSMIALQSVEISDNNDFQVNTLIPVSIDESGNLVNRFEYEVDEATKNVTRSNQEAWATKTNYNVTVHVGICGSISGFLWHPVGIDIYFYSSDSTVTGSVLSGNFVTSGPLQQLSPFTEISHSYTHTISVRQNYPRSNINYSNYSNPLDLTNQTGIAANYATSHIEFIFSKSSQLYTISGDFMFLDFSN